MIESPIRRSRSRTVCGGTCFATAANDAVIRFDREAVEPGEVERMIPTVHSFHWRPCAADESGRGQWFIKRNGRIGAQWRLRAVGDRAAPPAALHDFPLARETPKSTCVEELEAPQALTW